MANLYQFSLDRAVDGGGVPLSGAKLNVYATGTTTPATYWTDAAGTTAGSNPQTSDANGRFAPVFLDPGKRYRIKATDSAGTATLYDVDPVRGSDEGSVGGALMLESRSAGIARSIPADVSAVSTGGYAAKGDRGQALYARKTSSPGTAPAYTSAAWFQSADGAYWELSENELNPFMFGAKGDNATDDSAAIQAMFNFVNTKARPYPVKFMGAKYLVRTGLVLPKVPEFVAMEIDGGGATLRTDRPITILSCPMPLTQADAEIAIGRNAFDIHNLMFEGDYSDGQVGLHLIATYTSVVRSCYFQSLELGSIGTFCLASAWRDNRYYGCKKRAAVLQAADSFLTGSLLWTGTSVAASGCNVSVFDNCRVHGHPNQTSAFGIFGSDSVRMNGCISEGGGAATDVHFDYQGATVIKQFNVHMFHSEAPNGKLNFKVRATGQVVIDTLWTQYPAAIYDAQDSINCDIVIRGINYLGNPPVPGGTYHPITNPNPNGRWFYHSGGNGYGAASEGNSSSSVAWRFEDCFMSAYTQFGNPAKWEGGVLPVVLNIRGALAANNGVSEWSNAGIRLDGKIYLQDGSTLAGMQNGIVSVSTVSVPANSSVTEVFTATGIRWGKQMVFAHPYNSALPPAGIVWNAWIEGNDEFRVRFTNVTGSAITLSTTQWRYCAPRFTA